MLTAKRLQEVLHYDPITGLFTWQIYNSPGQRQLGKVAGTFTEKGYRAITVDFKRYMAHRLAWFYMTGKWPTFFIDHENCIFDDNRFCNLREATKSQNGANARLYKTSSSGLKGASRHKRTGLWHGRITHQGRLIFLGCFQTATEAHVAYCQAAIKLNGEFARTS